MDRKQSGKDAEKAAERFLNQQGLRTILRNAYCRMGEIDIVMQDQDTIVFVEVRKRKNSRYGGAAQSVDYRKQRKLIQAARYLMIRHPQWDNQPCRFDVIAFDDEPGGKPPAWFRDAFRP
ncbi:putative endonuclease distantly related to archaeal Holliday junction resolvase [Marinobacterium lacunae]|uniref:UPF0102 protein ADIMK_0357 n=1 Tax=Marinobacterium lacunae TaxID=1232683 RepID=A0A081G3P5_9GAMM|nr:YraN family protein [Marinobacterium lacunae]KEA65400.1 putative endonuclease distantly related to archaeal Holliday junction resolvase [Marinobacterium lacunae]